MPGARPGSGGTSPPATSCAAGSPLAACRAAAAGIHRLPLYELVSSTENNAVPIEAETCWVMLSSVFPRAMSRSARVPSAAEKTGIRVEPMPSPITTNALTMKP